MENEQEESSQAFSKPNSQSPDAEIPFWVLLVERCEREVEAEQAEENLKREYDSDPLAKIRKQFYNPF